MNQVRFLALQFLGVLIGVKIIPEFVRLDGHGYHLCYGPETTFESVDQKSIIRFRRESDDWSMAIPEESGSVPVNHILAAIALLRTKVGS